MAKNRPESKGFLSLEQAKEYTKEKNAKSKIFRYVIWKARSGLGLRYKYYVHARRLGEELYTKV